MGCHLSKTADDAVFHANGVDDSIHAMLEREKRRAKSRGEQPHTYVPPAPHPLLRPKVILASEEDDDDNTAKTSSFHKEDDSSGEIDRILYHTAHHCDTVDRRDLQTTRRHRAEVSTGKC